MNNTTVLLGWLPPETTKCCVDYYVLEVEMVKTSEFTTRKKKDRKFKRLYEGPAREYALYSVPYSVKIISRVFGVNPTGEGTPSDELVMSTPKGRGFRVRLCNWKNAGDDSHVTRFHLPSASTTLACSTSIGAKQTKVLITLFIMFCESGFSK